MHASARRNATDRRGCVRAWLFAATLAACVATASPRSTQESLGFGAKSAAAIPSYAISGQPAVLAVHGLNFAPGGAHPRTAPEARLRQLFFLILRDPSKQNENERAPSLLTHETHMFNTPVTPPRRLLVPALFAARGARAVPLRRASVARVDVRRRRRRRGDVRDHFGVARLEP